MKPLSAAEAISPAFTRTHQLLFMRPFRYGRIWKLCATSYLAYCGSVFIPFPLFLLLIPHDAMPGVPRALFLVVLIPFLLYLAILYFGVRMEFVEFEMIVTCTRRIAPMWSRYGSRVWPWLLTKIVLGTVLCTAFAPLLVSYVRSFAATASQMPAPAHGTPPDPQQVMAAYSAMLALQGFFFLVILALKGSSTILGDFVLPFYALQDISLSEAWRKGLRIIRAEPLHILGYLALKFLLAVAGSMLLWVGAMACMLPILILVVLLTPLFSQFGQNAAGHALVVAVAILLGLAAYLAIFGLMMATLGYLMNLLSSYAIFFLGGRYPLLGDFLEPPPPSSPFTPPPVFPSPDEKDDDGGPPFPMDPALA